MFLSRCVFMRVCSCLGDDKCFGKWNDSLNMGARGRSLTLLSFRMSNGKLGAAALGWCHAKFSEPEMRASPPA